MSSAQQIAQSFVTARRTAASLAEFPGPFPPSLDAAYRVQDAAIGLWPDEVVGWKVGWIAPDWQRVYGEERLVGPLFGRFVQRPAPGEVALAPVFGAGFAAIEAEFVVRLGRAAPARQLSWSADEARALVDSLHLGIELASSPLAAINDLGPAVTIADFGNNAGLILGPPIDGWRDRPEASLRCETWVDGRHVGRGGAASLPGGPFAALAFALACTARRGRPLQAGHWVTTGATTGVHPIRVGDSATVEMEGGAELRCRAVAALPVPS